VRLAAAGALAALLLAGPAAASAQDASAPPIQQESAAGLAVATFSFGCMQMLGVATGGPDFAARAQSLASGVQDLQKGGAAALRGTVSVAGVDGRTCRVAYAGPDAASLFTLGSNFSIDHQNGRCADEPRTATRAATVCEANPSNPGYRQSAARDGDKVQLDLTWLAPAAR
jgi:hypothetical protein